MPYYSAHLHLTGITLAFMLVFAILLALFGLALDLLTLSIWRRRGNGRAGRAVGLPLIPWMLYFLSSFIWLLRGNAPLGAILLATLTVWHVGLHTTIARSCRAATKAGVDGGR